MNGREGEEGNDPLSLLLSYPTGMSSSQSPPPAKPNNITGMRKPSPVNLISLFDDVLQNILLNYGLQKGRSAMFCGLQCSLDNLIRI